jgi:hypothetical protein
VGRGLSDLQITILLRALSNILERGEDHVHVFAGEVAADYFGWPEPDGVLCRRPPSVSAEKGNSVHAAICRAFRRLEDRGLGERVSGEWTRERWSGFRLNKRGREDAVKLKKLDLFVGRIIAKEREEHERVARLIKLLNSKATPKLD